MRVSWFVLLVVSCLLLVSSCARTVTQIVAYGEQMSVEVTLRGTAEVSSNRYFLVLALSSSLSVPLPPPDNISYEFIEPGTTPLLGTSEAYYTNYYSTWAGYIVLDEGGYFLVKGPFVSSQTPTRETLVSLGEEISNKISFNFRLGRIFDSLPDKIYFDFVTVPWPDGAAKLSSDHLTLTNAYISKISGSILNVEDEENSALSAAADILNCRVEIQ